jgi:hypothetical protein
VEFPGAQIERLDELIVPLVTVRAPGLLSLYGGGRTPPPCCSSRQATTRSGCAARPPGRICARSRLSKKDVIRCLKRYVAREVYPYLRG